jgi:carbamoyltransferase
MTVTYQTKSEKVDSLQGVTHVDGTCRLQTVNRQQNELFYQVLNYLKQKTGVGACLNTSFNLNYEPIVCTPQQAIATFYASGLDSLIIGNFIVHK